MKKPIIGITPAISENMIKNVPHYHRSLLRVGAIPTFLPYTDDEAILDQYIEDCDGFLFSGGVDVDPKYYGEEIKFESVKICEDRDNFEFALFKKILASGKPVLGICRGAQFLNVALGGTLHQHIDGHSTKDREKVAHTVTVHEGTRLFDIVGKASVIDVNTLHHQVIKDVAPCLVQSATSHDGYCEAVEMPDHKFFVAVQWHPEGLAHYMPEENAIFQTFVDATRE